LGLSYVYLWSSCRLSCRGVVFLVAVSFLRSFLVPNSLCTAPATCSTNSIIFRDWGKGSSGIPPLRLALRLNTKFLFPIFLLVSSVIRRVMSSGSLLLFIKRSTKKVSSAALTEGPVTAR